MDASFHNAWILNWPFSTWTASFIKVLKSISLTLNNHFSRVSAWEYLITVVCPSSSHIQAAWGYHWRTFSGSILRCVYGHYLKILPDTSVLLFFWKFWIFVNLGYFWRVQFSKVEETSCPIILFESTNQARHQLDMHFFFMSEPDSSTWVCITLLSKHDNKNNKRILWLSQ